MTPMKFSLCALNNYCDLNRSYLVLYLLLYSAATNVLLEEEEAVSDDDDDTRFTCVVTNLAPSIFKQINLRFNGALMSEQTDTCAYSAFFQTSCPTAAAMTGTRSCSRKAGSTTWT